jgi:hypothetical protein
MNAKQWSTLKALSAFQFPLSASEWGDPDVIALFENRLVRAQLSDSGGVTNWVATDMGANLVRLRAENCLFW